MSKCWVRIYVAGLMLFAVGNSACEAQQPRFIALLVGVTKYGDNSGFPPLRYSGRSIRELGRVLVHGGYGVVVLADDNPAQTKLPNSLYGADASKTAILDTLQALRCGPEDTLLVAFCGHGIFLDGINGQKGVQYFVPALGKKQDPATLLSYVDVMEQVAKKNARSAFVFLDACREAGGMSKDPSFKLPDLEGQLKPTVRMIFTCKKEKEAYFDLDLESSVFMLHLTKAIKHNLADPNSDTVDFTDMFRHVSKNVKKHKDLGQEPNEAEDSFYSVPPNRTAELQVIKLPEPEPVTLGQLKRGNLRENFHGLDDRPGVFYNKLFKGDEYRGVDLADMTFEFCRFEDCAFSEASSMTGATFMDCEFRGRVDFSGLTDNEGMTMVRCLPEQVRLIFWGPRLERKKPKKIFEKPGK